METTRSLTVLDPNFTGAHWMEVHAEGCADLRRKIWRGYLKGDGAWTIAVSSLTEAAQSIAGDFIAEGSMTVEDAIDEHIHFANCVHLPR
jgi:hypothetical protein